MTDYGQEMEVEILGCRIKTKPEDQERDIANTVIDLVKAEVLGLQAQRPNLKPTDVAVLVALKIATDKVKLEREYQDSVLKLERSMDQALSELSSLSPL